MERIMLVSDLMKWNVTTVQPETTLADAARIMLSRHVSGLPVVDGGALVGIVTEGDLLQRAELGTDGKMHSRLKAFFLPGSLAAEFVRTHGRYVRDVMTSPVISVTPDTPLFEAANMMCHHNIKRLPVMAGGKLAGVIGRTDLLAVLARRLIELDDPFTDADIEHHILRTLQAQAWAPKSGITVKVAGGIVDLEGPIISYDERRAVRVIAETTPGVMQVRDNLFFVDPTSGMSIPVA
jgi:CBS domain-containing protein